VFGSTNQNKADDSDAGGNNLVWHTTIEEAIKVAKAEDTPSLVQFSGSDWCKGGIKLNDEVLHTKEFGDYAKDHLVLVNLDFPRSIPQSDEVRNYNRTQMNKYGIRGFPTVLLMDKNGNVVKVTGYQPGGPAAYIQHIKAAYGME
jgi:protein disulfide-isomerase